MIQSHWMNEKEVAQLTTMSVHTIRKYRTKIDKIPFFKVGGSVRYRRADVLAWMEEKESRLCQ